MCYVSTVDFLCYTMLLYIWYKMLYQFLPGQFLYTCMYNVITDWWYIWHSTLWPGSQLLKIKKHYRGWAPREIDWGKTAFIRWINGFNKSRAAGAINYLGTPTHPQQIPCPCGECAQGRQILVLTVLALIREFNLWSRLQRLP